LLRIKSSKANEKTFHVWAGGADSDNKQKGVEALPMGKSMKR
jgi:hypothetical protein